MLKIGEYFRTPFGEIGKITQIAKHKQYCDDGFYLGGNFFICGKEAIKSLKTTPNIIDLIQIGDIITFKDDPDVYRVISVPDEDCALDVFYLAKNYDGETEDIMCEKEEMETYLYSIVTKEKFEGVEYKV